MRPVARATAGAVWVEGTELLRAPKAKLRGCRMAMVFQDSLSSLNPVHRVGRQIAEALHAHRRLSAAAATKRVVALLNHVGIPDPAARARARAFPHELSGGMRQRAMIAMGIANNPRLLIADEPTTALDVSVQAQILALFADLRCRLGIGLLFISHDLAVVRSLCDRVVVLYLGRVIEEGPAAEVLERPRHPYTQALLSASPSLDPARRRVRILLQGDPPSPSAPLSGRVFRPRCPLAIDACAATVPSLDEVTPGHRAACVRVLEAAAVGFGNDPL